MGKTRTLANGVSAGGPLVDGGTTASGTAVTTSGAASYEFSNIPAWAKRVTLALHNVSANGLSTGAIQLQLATSGGYLTSGYTFTGTSIDGTTITHNTGGGTAFQLIWTNSDAAQYSGLMELVNIKDNIWVHRMQMRVSTSRVLFSVGEIDLGAELTGLKAFMGVGTFDGGTINVLYS